jgi:hypothetical protein
MTQACAHQRMTVHRANILITYPNSGARCNSETWANATDSGKERVYQLAIVAAIATWLRKLTNLLTLHSDRVSANKNPLDSARLYSG